MSGRIRAKVLETGREAKINSPKPLKMPLEYVVTEKWDALAHDEKSNVDASESDERRSGVSGKVEYSRALTDFGSLKMKPVKSYDTGYESNSWMSHASSSVFSSPETGALRRLEEKVMFLCEHMTCTRIDDSSDDDDDSHIKKRRTELYTRTVKKNYGIEASKSLDFSLDSFDSDIVEETSSAVSIEENMLEENTLAKDELLMKERLKEVQEQPVLKIRAEDSLKENKLYVKKPPRMSPVRFEGKKHLKAPMLLTDDTSVVDKETFNLEETGIIPGQYPKKAEDSTVNRMETASEKVEEVNEEVEEIPCIEYTLSSHKKDAESIELDGIEVDVIEVDKFHFKAPLKEASTSTSPDCDDSILERTFSLTETEDSSVHVTDDIISVTLGSIGSLTSPGWFSKNDEVFDAPDFEYTLSTLKKHSFDADAVAKTVEYESSKTNKIASLVSVDAIPKHVADEDAAELPSIEHTPINGKSVVKTGSSADKDYSPIDGNSIPKHVDDEDAAELPSIEYTLNDGKRVKETGSSADKDYLLISGKSETDADQACKTTGRKYGRYLWRRFNRPSTTAAAKSVQRTTKTTYDKSAVAPVTQNDVHCIGSKMTDNKNAKETGSIADKEPSLDSMLLEHVAPESSALLYAGEASEMYVIPGKSETDANQALTKRDTPMVIDQTEPQNVFSGDATVGDSCEIIGRWNVRPRWRRSKRASAVAAAKSVERTTRVTSDKSVTDPPVDEGIFSLDDASAEKLKSSDLVASEPALAMFELLHEMNSPMSVTDAILRKSETDTDNTSTKKYASNEPEPSSETSEPRKGFIHRARSRSRSVTRGLKATRRSLAFGRESRSETDTDKTSTIKDASNEPEPSSETSEPQKEFIHRARSRSRSVTRGLMADRRGRSDANQDGSSASFRFPWWNIPRKEQATDAGEDEGVPNRQRRTKITMRQKERKEYAYKEMEDDENVDNLYQCYNCSCLPE